MCSLSRPGAADAQGALGAACPGPPQAVVVDENSDARLAQTFVPSASGPVTRAELDVDDVSGQTANYIVQILAADAGGTPTGTVLAEARAPDVPDGQATLQANFATPAMVVADQSYALALSRPGGHLGWDIRSDSAACPGKFFFQEGGGSWLDTVPGFGAADALFRLFLNPATTSGTSPATCKGKPTTITGTAANDKLQGTAGRDVIAGLGGSDKLSGLGGNDLICGGAGRDRLVGGKGRDKLLGQAGVDTLLGGPGRDRLIGGPGKDIQKQ